MSLEIDFGMILNLPDHHREEGVAVQRCYHNEQLCLHYQVTIDKLWICRYSSFSTGWKTSCRSIFKLTCTAAGTPSLSLWEVALNSQAGFASGSEEETALIKSQGMK